MHGFASEFHHLWEYLHHHPLFAAGIILIAGYYLGRLAGFVKLPEITGYIIAGLIIGKSFLNVVPHEAEESLGVFTQIALGLIALTIGGEFSLSKLKRLGKDVAVITLVQLLATFGAVSLGLFLLRLPLPVALLAGAIASATAPAATVHIVQTLKAHGTFVDILYGVVALDDAGCVILFSIIFSFAGSMLGIAGEGHGALGAIFHILLEIGIGAVAGYMIHRATCQRKSNNEILIITLGFFFTYTVFVMGLGMSPLLTNMAAGTVLINFSPRNHRIFKALQPLTPPLYALFFVLAGMELEPSQFLNPTILLLGTAYILFRAAGKYGGVYGGCALVKTEKRIKTYLGFCMLPQAGVAIGLMDIVSGIHLGDGAAPEVSAALAALNSVILMSVFVNEIMGPPLSKFALIRGNNMEE
ncbi:MAG: cation:proton antiporter [Spirochaetales bacterium]|nr:cation:proton antiporter [Spirochaetales bacterium]